ncbi:MAG: type VI secretion system tip protein VgrG [Ignavibacteriaceae bacterium]|nr:type VI secretion system tip protein VgrG [Ignavibacteriaceae bacterium]HRN25162.1 type VI secretion system tip protein TssI/VgrG [Ignavibacteriaceae bacterium]
MPDQKFNQPYYKIHLAELDDENIGVVSFEGREEISNIFEYEIVLATDNPQLDSSKILNKTASFTMIRSDESTAEIHGIISQVEQFGSARDHVFYKVVLVPRLWKANLTFQNEVYQNIEIKDLIEKVLKKSDLGGNDFKIDLKNKYPKSEFVVQYRETDFNFLNRRLEHFGIYYYFDHTGDKEVICFTDDNSKLPDVDLPEDIGYNASQDPFGDKESILDLSSRERVVTGTVQLKDYNYLFPEKQLMAQSQIDSNSPGMYYDYGDNFENEKDAEFLAKIRNQEFQAKSKIFKGKTNSRLFRAGYRYKMDRHYRSDWNSEYIITKLTLNGAQKGQFVVPSNMQMSETLFECRFESIPFDIDFRPERKTPIPKISGIMSAKLESGSGDEYAYLDDHGRYRFKALFDISDKSNGEASLPIRMTQSYSGSGYGIHFPNHKDAELLWACVDGNVDRPIGLGTVPNPSQASPVVSKNKSHNIIRTAAGNEIRLDDKSNETQIAFTTSDSHKFLMDDKDDKIEVISKDKHKIVMDDKNQNITITTKDGHTILLDDKNTKIVVTSKKGHFFLIDDTVGEEKIQMSDKPKNNNFIIDIINQKLMIETKDGSIDILAKDEIKLKSKKIIFDSEVETNCKTKDFIIQASKDFTLKASSKITQEAASDFKIKGMNLEAKGDMNTNVEAGMNITLKGGMAAKLEGGMTADVQGGTKTSVKGAVVMIN